MVSALTMLSLDEMMARYASYEDHAELVRHRFVDAQSTLLELYSKLVFNVLCGNTDDHARNHAAFWDGQVLELTPAYDICPQARTGNETSQAMLITGNDRMSRLSSCFDAVGHFLLSRKEAIDIAENQIKSIISHWGEACDEASLSATDRTILWRRQFLNAYAFDDLEEDAEHLKRIITGF